MSGLELDAGPRLLATRCRSKAARADIWDIAAITAFFGLSNRMASFAGMQPNPEFYVMGRLPKAKPVA